MENLCPHQCLPSHPDIIAYSHVLSQRLIVVQIASNDCSQQVDDLH